MFYNVSRFLKSEYVQYFTRQGLDNLQILTKVFPFKVSSYVLTELIDWDNLESDPIYTLTFPRREMLSDKNFHDLASAANRDEEMRVIRRIRHELNPHPNGQTDNIPRIGNRQFGGLQHKYRETVLFFPAHGQTCHSYCTYCFRWAQFVNIDEHKFKSKDQRDLFDYLSSKKAVTDILFTGGDPMWMNNSLVGGYLDVITQPELDHVRNIRIGTKALAFYPQRFLGEKGDELLRIFEQVIAQGKNLTIMAHFSHPRELSTPTVQQAIKRLRDTGLIIRTQAPLIRHINDDPQIWRDMWLKQVQLGLIPYYMFVERDTGAQDYFAVPLAEAYEIFSQSYSQISGLAKTVRGPSMSAWPGKILISGITGFGENKKFVLKFIQSRVPELINKPFFAKFDPEATWLDELEIEPPMKEHLENMAGYFEEDDMEIDEVA